MDKPLINVQVIQPSTAENWHTILKYVGVFLLLVTISMFLRVPVEERDVVGNTYHSAVSRYQLNTEQADRLAKDMSRWLTANPALVQEPYRLRRIVSEWVVHYDMVQ